MKFIGVSFFIFWLAIAASAWGGSGDKVKLKDVQVLTLNVGQFTNGRRSAGVPQIKCVGGTAGCQAFVPQVVQCYNRGFDGNDFQWECKADMDNAFRFGSIAVTCEGYDYPEDEYVLRGSCGLEYTIDYTQEGYQKKSQQTYGSNYQPYSSKYPKSKSSFFSIETIILGAGLSVVVYAIYKTCIAPTEHTDQRSRTNDDYGPRPDTSSRPPPAGFRPEYHQGSSAPGDDSCSGGTSRGASGSSNSSNFWTGAATGGLLGYMFGSRNSNSGYGGYNTYGAGTRRSGWFDNWGTNTGSYSGGGYSGGASFAGPSTSSGSRSASGFGGTRRR